MKKFLFVFFAANSVLPMNWSLWPDIFSRSTKSNLAELTDIEKMTASSLDSFHNRICEFFQARMRLAREICSLSQIAESKNTLYKNLKGDCEAYFLNHITDKLHEFSEQSHSYFPEQMPRHDPALANHRYLCRDVWPEMSDLKDSLTFYNSFNYEHFPALHQVKNTLQANSSLKFGPWNCFKHEDGVKCQRNSQ